MIYLQLFLGFLKVGCFSFGGAYAAIPIIRDVVLSNGWLTDDSLSNMIAVSESTPGPIMINLATYIGSSRGGILGALTATAAVVLPAFVIILLVMIALKNALRNKYVKAALGAVVPCIIGIIMAVGVFMTVKCFVPIPKSASETVKTAVLTAVLAVILFGSKYVLKKKISPILLIVISAALGAGVYGI